MRKHLSVLAAIGATALVAVPAYASTPAKVKTAAATTQSTSTKPAPKHYAVAEGDNLSAIAQAQGLASWRPLWDVNTNITNPDLIYPGQDLVIPDGATTARPLPDGFDSAGLDAASRALNQAQAAAPVQQPAYHPALSHTAVSGDWAVLAPRVRMRESGGNYAENTGNGYYGAYQFDIRTWNNFDGYARADLAPPAVQDEKAAETFAARGCSPWPNTCY